MGIEKIGHLAFVVSDMDRAERFYSGILGFPKAFELRRESGDPWIVYLKVAPGQFLELFYRAGEQDAVTTASVGYAHCCFIVDDIEEVAAGIVSRGGTLDRPVKVALDGNHQCWVRDPDGNRIEFMQVVPESPQARHSN